MIANAYEVPCGQIVRLGADPRKKASGLENIL